MSAPRDKPLLDPGCALAETQAAGLLRPLLRRRPILSPS
jgi:hypothetical protein